MRLIIDVGNSKVKVAVFKNDTILNVTSFDKKEMLFEIKNILTNHPISSAIISNVASISEKTMQIINKEVPLLCISHSTKLPFINLYKTPKTLGVDRIALVCSAVSMYPNKNVLIIDAGTCITFDFINDKKEYLGGAISPGIRMRYMALNKFTANLPLLSKTCNNDFIGASTQECINSGVVAGIVFEIEGAISAYSKKFRDLTVVLTGGDTNFLLKQLKSSIFANQNFLLYGLNKLLILNEDK